MSDKELKSTIAIEVDGSGVSTGVSAVKRDLSSLGTAATEAGKAMAGVGGAAQDGMKGAGQAVEATQRTINAFVSQIKNSVTDIKAAGDAAEKYRLRAIDKGIPENIYAPYVAQLKAVQQEQLNLANAAVKTNGQVEMSARAMSNAMRGVPAQFTDIVTSLTSGQAPLTVLMQQGGQLKDMFGGVGNAFKALGGYVVGLINPMSLAVAAVGAFGYAAYRAAEDSKALQNALILTGTQGVTSLSNLENIAKGLSAVGVSSGVAREALIEFVNAGVRVDSNLQAITKAAIDLEKYGGAAVQDTAKAFAKLSKDPLADLDRLTLATYRQIEALLEQGDRTGAVVAAQKAFTESTENTAKALSAQQGPLNVAAQAWKRYGAEVWSAVKGITAAALLTPKTGDAARQELQARRDRYAAEGYDTTKEDAELARYKRLDEAQKQGIANLQKEGELKTLLAKFNEKDESTRKQRERNLLLADNNRLLAEGLITQKQYDDSLKAFDKAPQARNRGPSEADKGLKTYNDLVAKSIGLNADFAEQWDKLGAAYKAGKVSLDGLILAQAELLKEQKFSKDIVKSLAAETDAYAKAEAANTAAHVAAINAQDKRTQQLQEQLAKQLEHNAAIGLSAEAVGGLEMATHLLNAAELERKANLQDGVMRSLDVIDGLRAQAKLEREIAEAKRAGGAKKAADEALKEWQKTAEKINDSITDALMRGFESGKDFAANLRDTVVNMFKTLVLRPVVSAVVNPVAQGITGALGLSGAANAAGTIGVGNTVGALTLGGSTIAAIGSSVATGISAGLAGTSLAGATAAYSAAGMTGVAGGLSAGSAIGSGLAAIGPVGWAALAAVAVSQLLKGNGGTPTSGTGEASVAFDSSGRRVSVTANEFWGGLSASADKAIQNLQNTYTSAARSLGIGTVGTSFAFGSNTGKDSQGNNFALSATAGASSFSTGGEQVYSDAAFSLAASRAVFAALQGSDLPAYLAKVFNGLTAGELTQDQITNTLAYAQTLKQVRDGLLETREPLQILKDNVAEGIAALGTSSETFKTDFVAAIDNGITPEKLAQWQGLQTAMSDLAVASGKAADAVKDVGRSIADIANERQRLETQLLELQGNTVELRRRELAALDPSNRALQESIYALQDAKAAQDAYNTALADAQSRMSAASSALESAQNAVDAIRSTGTDQYLNALDKVAQAQDAIAQAAQSASQKMVQLGQSLRDFVTREVLSTAGGTPSIAVANASFARTLAQAKGGNADAIAELESRGRIAIDAARAGSTSSAQYQAIRNAVLQGVASVASTLPNATQAQGADLQQRLIDAQTDLAEALRVANAIGAPLQRAQADLITRFSAAQSALASAQAEYAAASAVLEAIKTNTAGTTAAVQALNSNLVVQLHASAQSEITKLISIIGDDTGLAPDLKVLALMGTESVSKTIDLLATSNITPDLKALALASSSAVTKTIGLVVSSSLSGDDKALALMVSDSVAKNIALAATSNLAPDLKTLALLESGSIAKYISLVANSSLSPDDKTLALMASSSVVKTIGAALGSLDATALSIALAQSDTLTRTISAVGGTLTEDQRTVLQALTGASSVSVNVSGTTTANVMFDPADPVRSVWTAIKDATLQSAQDAAGMHSALTWIASMVSNMLNHISTVHVVFNRGDGQVFAKGGVFTNRIVDQPTTFDQGLMGEAGPEAIMPLRRGPDGSLGVVAAIDYRQFGRGNDALVAEIRTLREENRAQASAIVNLNQRMTKIFERWDGNGLPTERVEA